MTITKILRQLIIDKYGIEKFDFGCEVVAQFVNGYVHSNITSLFIKDICKEDIPADVLTLEQEVAIRRLFGINYDP